MWNPLGTKFWFLVLMMVEWSCKCSLNMASTMSVRFLFTWNFFFVNLRVWDPNFKVFPVHFPDFKVQLTGKKVCIKSEYIIIHFHFMLAVSQLWFLNRNGKWVFLTSKLVEKYKYNSLFCTFKSLSSYNSCSFYVGNRILDWLSQLHLTGNTKLGFLLAFKKQLSVVSE